MKPRFEEHEGQLFYMLEEPAKEPKPEQPKYNVGDWVEWHEGLGTTYQSQITRISHSAVYSKGICIPLKIITRKLKPSEVVVKIGCLSGTVAEFIPGCDCDWAFKLIHGNGKESYISPHALDSHTRELVESLLKAQEKEK